MNATQPRLDKYRVIIIAVALFLVLDLGVLILNFFTSYQISQDAVSINMAGRQRMLSQRMSKALLSIASDAQQGQSIVASKNELGKTVALFDSTLNGFQFGGKVMGSNGALIDLNAIQSAVGIKILHDAIRIWQPYQQGLQPILQPAAFSSAQLGTAIQLARENNIKLLDLMNNLTNNLEQIASTKAEHLRLVQSMGIGLALLNFGFILFKFLRSLRRSDQLIEQAQQETDEILATVKEGLFLLDQDYKIGNQFSVSLSTILRQKIQPGTDFASLLGNMSTPETLASAQDYISLLFGKHVKENLITSLNPLNEIEVQITDARGKTDIRYLSFQFNRVWIDERISHLLVTVQDVTEQVRLMAELAEIKAQARVGLNYLQKILSIERGQMQRFLSQMEDGLNRINSVLQQACSHSGVDYRSILQQILQQTHSIKGDAATLGLSDCENAAHGFEQNIIRIRDQVNIKGDDLVSLTVQLDEFFDRLSQVRSIIKSTGTALPATNATATESIVADMQALAQRIATDQRKQVSLTTHLEALDKLPECLIKELRQVTIQLLRNAISHGIETPAERLLLNKPAVGKVQIVCKEIRQGQFEWILRDDGRGLDPARIRQALVRNGLYTAAEATAMGDRNIIMKIFEPGFSTVETAHKDAGHGIGLDLIHEKINTIGGRLQIKTRVNHYAEFILHFALGHIPANPI